MSIATKLVICFVVCLSKLSSRQHMSILYFMMELIIVHKDEGVNKSPHLENAMFALSAEQNDLIHAVCRNCLLGVWPMEVGNNTAPKWLLVASNANREHFHAHKYECLSPTFFKGDKVKPFAEKRFLMLLCFWQGKLWCMRWWPQAQVSHVNAGIRRWRHPASHTSVAPWFVWLLQQKTGKVLRGRGRNKRWSEM